MLAGLLYPSSGASVMGAKSEEGVCAPAKAHRSRSALMAVETML